MAAEGSQSSPPQDLVAIFHASFHPTKGNIVDWSVKADDNVDLSRVEFSCLPSGLHSVNEDVVYFTKDDHQGVCVFRRRKTSEQGHRGFRLSSLGILLAPSSRPRPWKHVHALKALVHTIYTSLEDRAILEPTEDDWEPARAFFEERRARHGDLGGAGVWRGWDDELEVPGPGSSNSPTIHLPHLLQILGPSSLTLYKHVLGRRRILIYTQPPVEAACILCQVAADLCYEEQVASSSTASPLVDDPTSAGRLKGKSKESVQVLGMVTLSDLDRLDAISKKGRGWIACTTDAIFLEKPSYYDLVIDLTATPNKGSRPALSTSKLADRDGNRRPTYKLSTVRFTWSDMKLWTELDRIMHDDFSENGSPDNSLSSPSSAPSSSSLSHLMPHTRQPQGANAAWPDVWRVYEDVCVICAGLWMGPWRGSSAPNEGDNENENWGSTQRSSSDDTDGPSPRKYTRNAGMGVGVSEVGELRGRNHRKRQSSGSSILWSWASARNSDMRLSSSGVVPSSSSSPQYKDDVDDDLDAVLVQDSRERRVASTLLLLRVFNDNTRTLLARFSDLLVERSVNAHSHNLAATGSGNAALVLTPKDLMAFDLGPLSGLDGHFVEWVAEEYGGGVKVSVRRGWRDIFALIFGLS